MAQTHTLQWWCYKFFELHGEFIYKVSSRSPTRHFIIHSRKALLNGISPADNRKIPPLKYEYYYALLRDFPDLRLTINGGINGVDEVTAILVNAARMEGAHGVMVPPDEYISVVPHELALSSSCSNPPDKSLSLDLH
ncbi:hypothetical protein HYC85_013790 [Camellia sinensis]|uniref:DUS-like FMN-binding domain-containing protein n=1 Tax=Camellia sinensis TaxID=4442 RepID=A0A7J7H4B3_CAMSI|nr:hypothetical protein HYC85_013790 [Camellia sinensis]